MSDAAVLEDLTDRILTLTLARPRKKNALTLAMYEQMTAGLERAASNPDIRAVVLRGCEGVFTAGNDLGDFMNNPLTADDSPVARFLQAIEGAPKPLVAAVEGLAIGVGTTMLLHCDLVYAAEGTRFQLPFTPLGLCPEAGSSYFLPRMAGYARAAELLLLGEPFGPDVALQIGLVARVLPPEDLHDHARDRALAVAALPPASVRVTKQLMKEAQRDAVRAHMGREVGHFLERLRSPEAAEAMQAFFAKRKPDFSRFE